MKIELDLSEYQWTLVISAVSERRAHYEERVKVEPAFFPIGDNRTLKKDFSFVDDMLRRALDAARVAEKK